MRPEKADCPSSGADVTILASRPVTQLHVEDLEIVALRDSLGGGPNRGQPFRRHA